MLARPDRRGDLVTDLAYDVPTITILTLIGADIAPGGHLQALVRLPRRDDLGRPERRGADPARPQPRRVLAGVPAPGRRGPRGRRRQPDRATWSRSQQDGAEITDHEIASVCYSLLFAGHETTTTLISNALRVLLAHREQWQADRRRPQAHPRRHRRGAALQPARSSAGGARPCKDTEVGGVAIPEGAAAAAPDGLGQPRREQFDAGEAFDITRPNAREHLSFGYGIHYCLGNMLAKLQARIALEEVARLAPEPALEKPDAIAFGDNLSFRVPEIRPRHLGGLSKLMQSNDTSSSSTAASSRSSSCSAASAPPWSP